MYVGVVLDWFLDRHNYAPRQTRGWDVLAPAAQRLVSRVRRAAPLAPGVAHAPPRSSMRAATSRRSSGNTPSSPAPRRWPAFTATATPT